MAHGHMAGLIPAYGNSWLASVVGSAALDGLLLAVASLVLLAADRKWIAPVRQFRRRCGNRANRLLPVTTTRQMVDQAGL
ncbi:hypothetical protein [Streptomyces sp. RKAG293]|uniref:hypothetical protein n=1 Tax=Streptomyces sp. RKAG293 TaxID=2893403 RepID=UPI002034456E|nr:hypothetical protein [Streptomyces sp. RKAG293]MCM2416525.1 hypothetical protein [Streptomyces sp. RKAG293]